MVGAQGLGCQLHCSSKQGRKGCPSREGWGGGWAAEGGGICPGLQEGARTRRRCRDTHTCTYPAQFAEQLGDASQALGGTLVVTVLEHQLHHLRVPSADSLLQDWEQRGAIRQGTLPGFPSPCAHNLGKAGAPANTR